MVAPTDFCSFVSVNRISQDYMDFIIKDWHCVKLLFVSSFLVLLDSGLVLERLLAVGFGHWTAVGSLVWTASAAKKAYFYGH